MRQLVIFLLLLTLIHSATLFGNIYEADSLTMLNNTILKIEGPISNQIMVNEQYSVTLPEGRYKLTAIHYNKGKIDYITKENVLVNFSSTKYDLILLPYELYALTPAANSTDANILQSDNEITIASKTNSTDYAIFIYIGTVFAIFVIVVILLVVFRNKKTKPSEQPDSVLLDKTEENYLPDKDAQKILEILKDNEGRMYQREVRQILNWSEAKMSVIVTELEVSGVVKRFKKGRGNLIKLLK